MNTEQTKNYNAFDVMKFVSSLLVICIHIDPFWTYSENINFVLVGIIARIAVPFYFTSSGYLLFNKILRDENNSKTVFTNYIKSIFMIYIKWSAFYFILILNKWIRNDVLNLNSFLLYIRDFIFVGSYFQLWYLTALMFSVAAVYFLLKYFSIVKILVISLLFYLVGLLGDSYYGLLLNSRTLLKLFDLYRSFFLETRNGLFFGFVFVALGAYIAYNQITIKANMKYLLASFGLLFIEAMVLRYFKIPLDVNMYLSLLPVTYFLFIALKNINLKDNIIYKYLRDSSLLIFCSHPLFMKFITNFTAFIGKPQLNDNSLIRFILVTICTLVFSFSILLLAQNKKFQRLKSLYR